MDEVQILLILVIIAIFLALIPLYFKKSAYAIVASIVIMQFGALISITDTAAKNSLLPYHIDDKILTEYTRQTQRVVREGRNGHVVIDQFDETEAVYG